MHRTITELIDAAASFDQGNTGSVVDAELSFQTGLGQLLARKLDDERVNFQLNTVNFVGRELVLVAQLNTSVDSGMHHNTAGKWLVRIDGDFVGLTQCVGDVAVIVGSADDIRPAILCFKTLLGAGEVA